MFDTGKTIAVMQPYIFPYIGYFQLINAVDHFVFYDDVNYIKGGWINRNKILINNKESLFTIPLNNSSSFKEIKDVDIHLALFEKWKRKFLKSLKQSYSKAPYFEKVYPQIDDIFNKNISSISELAICSTTAICDYLNMETKFYISSKQFANTKGLNRAERLVEIVKSLKFNHYINPIGGNDLYEKTFFEDNSIQLNFLKPKIESYAQFEHVFVPGLSIIDVLMFNPIDEIIFMLNQYELE